MSSLKDYIKKSFGIQDKNLKILKIEENVINKKGINYQVISSSLSYKAKECPHCHNKKRGTIVKNGNYISNIIDGRNDPTIFKVKKQRFLCKECGHTFCAETSFAEKHHTISTSTILSVLNDLKEAVSQKHISRKHCVSPTTVNHTIYRFLINNPKRYNYLPEHLSIDEFQSTDTLSFVCCDSVTHNLIDIFEKRTTFAIKTGFMKYSIKARENVKTVTMDMFKPYINTIQELFPNAEIITDKFHIVNHMSRALNKTRIENMNHFRKDSKEYKRLKRPWKSFLKREGELDSIHFKKFPTFNCWVSEQTIVEAGLNVSDEFLNTYNAYQDLLADIKLLDFEKFERDIQYHYNNVSNHFKKALNTFKSFSKYIRNTFKYSYTNGCIEGINNKIKTFKKVSYGFNSFEHMRARLLLAFNVFSVNITTDNRIVVNA